MTERNNSSDRPPKERTQSVQKTPGIHLHTSSNSPLWQAKFVQEVPVKIVVGQDIHSRTYYLSPTLLMSVSGYFRACLGGNFAETTSNEVNLTETDPKAFEDFISWMLNDIFDRRCFPVSRLVRVWIMADSILCEGLQNNMMDLLHGKSRGSNLHSASEHLQILNTIVDSTSVDSQLKHYYIQILSWTIAKGNLTLTGLKESAGWKALSIDTAKDLIFAVSECLQANNPGQNPALGNSCVYHVHVVGSSDQCKRQMSQEMANNHQNAPITSTSSLTAPFDHSAGSYSSLSGDSPLPRTWWTSLLEDAQRQREAAESRGFGQTLNRHEAEFARPGLG